MENIKKLINERYITWFTAIVLAFHIVLSMVHYFLPVSSLYPLNYVLIIITLAAWIIYLLLYHIKPHLGKSFIILVIMLLWYLLSCQVMTGTYHRSWFVYNKDSLYDTLLLTGLVFPIGVYTARKGCDTFVQILIHILVFVWTCFMVFVLIHVFQNNIINTPSGGQIGMSSNIALCLNTHYNTTGLIELVMVTVVLFIIFTNKSLILRITYGLACLVHMVALVLSNSRTSFVAVLIIFASFIFSIIYNAKWDASLQKRILTGAAAAIITIVLLLLFRKMVFFVHENVTHLRALIKPTSDTDTSARDLTSMKTMQSRFKIWKSSVQAMVIDERRFIFGVTPASVIPAITEASGETIKNVYTHNQFLEVGVALGVPGMILFILFVFLLAKNSFQISIKNNKGATAWFAVSIVVTLLIANLSEATLMFYRFLSSYPFFLFSGWISGSAEMQINKKTQVSQRKIKKKK